jgi:hypothetical protein
MFGWLFNSVEKKMLENMRSELENFRDSLKGMSNEEIGLVLALANHVRLGLESIGHKPLEPLTYPDFNSKYQHELFASIQKLQKQGQLQLAGAMMVWLHTARSGLYPPLRHLGQEMWKELQRGLPNCDAMAAMFRANGGMTLNTLDAELIPIGLEPRN